MNQGVKFLSQYPLWPLTIAIFAGSAAAWWQSVRLCVWSNSDLLHSRIKILAQYSCPLNLKGLFDVVGEAPWRKLQYTEICCEPIIA